MNGARHAIGAAALAALVSCGAGGGGDAVSQGPAPSAPAARFVPVAANCPLPDGFAPQAQEVIDLTRAFRAETGLQPVTASAQLTIAAQNHACQMARTGRFDHVGPDGSEPSDRAERAGYNWDFVAENIAFGQPFASGVFANWKGSTGHRKNMINPQAEEIGIGIAAAPDGTLYWVMLLGSQFDITALAG